MSRSKSSSRWLQEHFADVFVKQAQKEGYRSRAVYKLKEIDEKEKLLKPGLNILDLGAAPGGWSQYVSQKMQGKGLIVAVDLLPMQAIDGVNFIRGDFTEDETLAKIQKFLPLASVDLLLSDMAPNMSGSAVVDNLQANSLAELVFEVGDMMLKPGASLFIKLFHGAGFDELVKFSRQKFAKVSIRKPKASRARSRETYLLAKGYNL